MKIRVYIATATDYRDCFVEIECDGQPRPGDFFSLPDHVEEQLLRMCLSNYDHFTHFTQWLSFDSIGNKGTKILSFEDSFVVHEVSWWMKEDVMKCYISLDCDTRESGQSHAELSDYETISEEEYHIIKTNTETYYNL